MPPFEFAPTFDVPLRRVPWCRNVRFAVTADRGESAPTSGRRMIASQTGLLGLDSCIRPNVHPTDEPLARLITSDVKPCAGPAGRPWLAWVAPRSASPSFGVAACCAFPHQWDEPLAIVNSVDQRIESLEQERPDPEVVVAEHGLGHLFCGTH